MFSFVNYAVLAVGMDLGYQCVCKNAQTKFIEVCVNVHKNRSQEVTFSASISTQSVHL
jgi:hypothetical protein